MITEPQIPKLPNSEPAPVPERRLHAQDVLAQGTISPKGRKDLYLGDDLTLSVMGLSSEECAYTCPGNVTLFMESGSLKNIDSALTLSPAHALWLAHHLIEAAMHANNMFGGQEEDEK